MGKEALPESEPVNEGHSVEAPGGFSETARGSYTNIGEGNIRKIQTKGGGENLPSVRKK